MQPIGGRGKLETDKPLAGSRIWAVGEAGNTAGIGAEEAAGTSARRIRCRMLRLPGCLFRNWNKSKSFPP